MKKLPWLFVILLPLLFVSCNKDKVKRESARFFSNATAPVISEALNCDTGNYTAKFVEDELYKVLKGGEEKQKSVGTVICQTGLGYLQSKLISLADEQLSDEMRSDKCSTTLLADKGYQWVLDKCPK